MPRLKSEPVFIGIGGHVVAIDSATGTELWRAKLKTSQFVTIMPMQSRVLAGAGGELFCLDARTGELLWRNKLKGLGLGLLSFGGSETAVAAMMEQARAGAAAGGS